MTDKSLTVVSAEAGSAVAVYGEFTGEGHESASASEFKMPLLSILQALSPEVAKRGGVEGAEAGMYYAEAAGLLIDGEEGFTALVCGLSHVVVEWRDRNGGNPGIENVHVAGSPTFNAALASFKFGEKLVMMNGNIKSVVPPVGGLNTLEETFYLHLLLTENSEVIGELLFPCAATKIAAVKAMNTKMRFASRGFAIPKYAFQMKFTTKEKKGPKGTYYVPDIAFLGGTSDKARIDPTSPLFRAAREVYLRAPLAGKEHIILSDGGPSEASGDAVGGMDVPF